MNPLRRVWEYLKGLVGGNIFSKRRRTPIKGRDPRPYLSGAAPGLWASNHLSEADQVKGWQFVAVRTLARMAASAETSVHEIVTPARDALYVQHSLRKARAAGDRNEFRRLRRQLQGLRKMSAPTAQGTKQERKPVPWNDPLLRLLNKPNPIWSGSIFRFQAIQQLAATGSAMLWVVRNAVGVPAELYVIPTGLCIPRMPTEEYPRGSYWITPLTSWGLSPLNQDGWVTGALGSALLTGCEVDGRDVKAVRWPHPLYLSDGLAVAAAIAVWIDVATQMDLSCWYGLQNSERPGLVFKRDPAVVVDPADMVQLREDLASEHAGSPNTGKHLILPPGFEADDRGRTAADLDYEHGGPDYRDRILAAHGVNPCAAGVAPAVSYAAYWAGVKQTTEIAVQPMLDLLGEDLTVLLGNAYRPKQREVNFKARAIDDPQLQENRLGTDIKAGNTLLVKEYRAMRGLPPLGDERDEAFVGVRTSVTEKEKDLEEPGDKPASDEGSGTREQHRDAVPGRADRGGKSRLRKSDFDEDKHSRDERGRFGEGGGSGGGGEDETGWQESDEDQAAREAEDAARTAQDEAAADQEEYEAAVAEWGQYDADHAAWEDETAQIQAEYDKARAEYNREHARYEEDTTRLTKRYEEDRTNWQEAHAAWEERGARREKQKEAIDEADPVDDASRKVEATGTPPPDWGEKHPVDHYRAQVEAFAGDHLTRWDGAFGKDSPTREALGGTDQKALLKFDRLAARGRAAVEKQTEKYTAAAGKYLDYQERTDAEQAKYDALSEPSEPEQPDLDDPGEFAGEKPDRSKYDTDEEYEQDRADYEQERAEHQAEKKEYDDAWSAYDKDYAQWEKDSAAYEKLGTKLEAMETQAETFSGKMDNEQDAIGEIWDEAVERLRDEQDEVKNTLTERLDAEAEADEEPEEPEEPDYPDEPEPPDEPDLPDEPEEPASERPSDRAHKYRTNGRAPARLRP